MTVKAITPKQAYKINRKLGLEIFEDDDVKTFWATNTEESATWIFDSNKERKEWIESVNSKIE